MLKFFIHFIKSLFCDHEWEEDHRGKVLIFYECKKCKWDKHEVKPEYRNKL